MYISTSSVALSFLNFTSLDPSSDPATLYRSNTPCTTSRPTRHNSPTRLGCSRHTPSSIDKTRPGREPPE
ncbi:hypothetical protein B0T18DRAFT_398488 [Schizothecium vesticola]|uniref:Uncharacterized protein n=1 Tax=Schizothecium vesticola TaxID=314040 RepID=A0AA40FAB8_9PEZI|nr:hypothetical protein B0T18DRAFT_398488 [Schizothecium vesticola]